MCTDKKIYFIFFKSAKHVYPINRVLSRHIDQSAEHWCVDVDGGDVDGLPKHWAIVVASHCDDKSGLPGVAGEGCVVGGDQQRVLHLPEVADVISHSHQAGGGVHCKQIGGETFSNHTVAEVSLEYNRVK